MSNNFIDKYSDDIKELQLGRTPFKVYTDGVHKFIYYKPEEQGVSVNSFDLNAFNW